MKEIFERRSVRSYTSEDVSAQDEDLLLRAAMQAPSAGNEQPWHFVVIRDREVMLEIEGSQQYATMLKTAPMAVVVCGDRACAKYPHEFWVQDCSAALENLLLEAVHLGLGAVWMGVYPVPERVENLKRILGLPESVYPLGIVAVGHPDKAPQPADRFDASRVHKNKW